MKTWINTASFFVLAIFIAACGHSDNEKAANTEITQPEGPYSASELNQQDSVWKEMMLIHDSVMPKAADINRMSQNIKKQLSENSKLNELLRNQMITALEYLEQSDASMFDWMNNLQQLNKLREGKTHEEIMAYLLQEKTTIAKVSKDMLKSIELGDQVLKQTGN